MLLSDRVEALTVPDRKVDALIWRTCFPDEYADWLNSSLAMLNKHFSQAEKDEAIAGREQRAASTYSASLDAAMTLFGKHEFWRVGHDGEGQDPGAFKGQVGVEREGECWHTFATAIANTPAIALTAAALRSRGL